MSEENRFSWGLALAGAVAAAAVSLVLLTLGAGIGLWLVRPESQASTFLTGGAIYFFAAQAFGFAVGGHVAGRLLGPYPETVFQEEVRAAIHGLVVWGLAVLATMLMIAAAGASIAALYGRTGEAPQRNTAVVVDRMFRPGMEPVVNAPGPVNSGTPAPGSAESEVQQTPAPVAGDGAHARAEAGRLIEADFAPGGTFSADDRTRLIQLVSQQATVPTREATLRVAAAEAQLTRERQQTIEQARKTASTASLWIACSLLFGALVAMVAAVTARLEDDRETAWSLFAFHRGWRS